ncbi:MAG: MmcQ/YjbR family DNA-binding protein [Bacteroidota bacterium]
MTLEAIQRTCNSFPDVTEDIKWESHLCFNVGGKIFLITSPDLSPITASFKTSEEKFNELTERKGFKPAPYLAKHKWVYVDDISRMNGREWKELLELSYDLVRAKLSKKKK